jgi:trans-aconitate methyltransferase
VALGQEAAQEYILGADDSELVRLLAQAEIRCREAELLLDRISVGAGARALDVGCGPLGVLHLLSERVGPTGEVVGLDRERRMVVLAGRTIAERGLANVRLLEGKRPRPVFARARSISPTSVWC